MFTTFAELDRLGGPVYREYKARLDGHLGVQFGVSAEDLRPWHYSDPFFQEAPASDPPSANCWPRFSPGGTSKS